MRHTTIFSLTVSAIILGATVAHYTAQMHLASSKAQFRQTLDASDDPIGTLIDMLPIQEPAKPQYVPAPQPAQRSFIPDNKFDIQVKRRALVAGTMFDGNLDTALICRCGGGDPVCFCYAPNK